MFKKIISTALIVCTCLTMVTPVYASEASAYLNLAVSKPKIEKAAPFIPEDDNIQKDNVKEGGLINVDSTSIGDVSVLSNTPSTSIKVNMGTSTYEYLSAAEEVWYSFQTVESPGYQGTYDIFSSGSTDTYGELYRKDSSGNMVLLDSDDDNGDGNNFKFVYYLNGSTIYYAKVRGFSTSTTGNLYFNVKRHVDTATSSLGGSWTPASSSPNPIVNGRVYKKTYLDIGKTRELYDAMVESGWADLIQQLMGMTVTAGISYISTRYGVNISYANVIYGVAVLGNNMANSNMAYRIWNFSNGMSNGIVVTYKIIDGTKYYTIESWIGSTVYGEPGYFGNPFNASDFQVGR